jgi:hypothetical protein
MNIKDNIKAVVTALVITTGLLVVSAPGYSETASERSGERQNARDLKQEGRGEARDTKAECKAGDEKTRAECRQDKRETKQNTRDAARAIKQK